MNGADILCDTLLVNDVDVCFANPGTSEMHFVAALDRKPQMRCILGLFEGVVTGAADGYARMAERPAATLLHTGPGLANGLANLHNARRARTPMINIVGDHAAAHLPFDAPLTSDIEGLAWPMSDWVHRIGGAGDVAGAMAQAVAIARNAGGGIATLILPADAAWNPVAEGSEPIRAGLQDLDAPDPSQVVRAAEALREPGETVILMSGTALRDRPSRLAAAIAKASGARLLAQQSNARIERGAGRIAIERTPYKVDLALECFRNTQRIILIGAKAPVAFFAYPGKPSSMMPPDCEIIPLACPGDDLPAAIEALAGAMAIDSPLPPPPAPVLQEPVAHASLTPENIALTLALHIPENAIICDESISSGRDFFGHTHGAAAHDFLQLTGGAIGAGLPMSVGAAVACPNRKVIALQADGSGMYTNQALWTMAREGLDVLVIIFANRSYEILHNELIGVGANAAGKNARRMLDLDNPALDWVQMAQSMGVAAARAETTTQLGDLIRDAAPRKGPFLIEAVM